jgi:carbon monoxide dehydrogenase subunit G
VNLDGSAVLPASPEAVWSVLTDPAVLARTIPGCVSLEQVGEDSYRMNVAVGVGAIRGSYAGEVHLTDQQRPSSYVMHASGAGAPGQVRATVPISLEAVDGGTRVTYSADAVVGGPVAGVGQRMLTGVAKRMAGQFFAAIGAELTGPTPVVELVDATVGGSAEPSPLPTATFAGSAAAGGWIPADARPVLVGAAGGGLLTLLGVWLGVLIGRRHGPARATRRGGGRAAPG